MKETIENTAAKVLYHSGLQNRIHRQLKPSQAKGARFQHIGNRPKGAYFQILIYHRVHPKPDPGFLGAPDPEQFKKQMHFLKKYYQVLPLKELIDRSKNNDLAPLSVALTFDDGYKDNLDYAFPILQELGMPATLFVATDGPELRRSLWYDRIYFALKHSKDKSLTLPVSESDENHMDASPGLDKQKTIVGGKQANRLDKNEKIILLENEETTRRAAVQFILSVRYLPEANRLQLTEELFHRCGVNDFSSLDQQMLDWDSLQFLDKKGIDIQPHTQSHPSLSTLSDSRIEEEIMQSRKLVEKHLQKEARHFAYPVGKPEDYDQRAVDCLHRNGFLAALTTDTGLNTDAADLFHLRRSSPWHDTIAEWALDQVKIQWGS